MQKHINSVNVVRDALNHFHRFKAFRLIFFKEGWREFLPGQVVGCADLPVASLDTLVHLVTDHNNTCSYAPASKLKTFSQYLEKDSGSEDVIIGYSGTAPKSIEAYVKSFNCPIELGKSPVLFPSTGDAVLWLTLNNQNLKNYTILRMTYNGLFTK